MGEGYLERRRAIKLGLTPQTKKTAKDKDELSKFYEEMAERCDGKCEECGTSLGYTINFHPRAHIAHILKKSKTDGCPSVATNKNNIVYLCKEHHDNFDHAMENHNYEYVKGMNIFPKLLKRIKLFIHFIPDVEKRRIPSIFLNNK